MRTQAIGNVHPSQGPDQMRALKGVLLLSIALSALSSAAQALELGPCEPSKAVKIIDTRLEEGKTLSKPWR